MQGSTPGGTVGENQRLWRIHTETGAQTEVGTFSAPNNASQVNAMGISANGESVYGIYRVGSQAAGTQTIFRNNTTNGTTTTLGTTPQGVAITHGAVNPDTGIYYYGGFSGAVLNVYGFNPNNGTNLGLVASGTVPTSGGNGDFAFDNSGNLYYVGADSANINNKGSTLGVIGQALPTTPNSAITITGTAISVIRSDQGINGIAYGSDGLLYMSSGNRLFAADPTSGDVLRSPSWGIAGTTDMGSCAVPSTLTLQKDFVDGRFAADDQVTLNLTGNGLEVGGAGNTGVTQGNQPGVQNQRPSELAGPVPVRPNRTFYFNEVGAGADELNYDSSYVCVDQSTDTELTSGDGTSGEVTIPATAGGSNVVCTFSNDAQRPSMSLQKTSSLADENENNVADAGEVITYTFIVTNTGETVLARTSSTTTPATSVLISPPIPN